MPWEGEASSGKYSYHPAGDASASPRDAPSAINVVVIPDVNLPKVCSTYFSGPDLLRGGERHICADYWYKDAG